MFKNMSFRNMIVINVFLVFFVFSVVIFFVFNSFYLNNLKQKFIDENKYSQKVTEDYLFKEIGTLVFFSKQISLDKILRVALKTGNTITINDVSLDKPIQVEKTLRFNFTTIANNIRNQVFGGSESLIRRDLELYTPSFELLATTSIQSKKPADPRLLSQAFGSINHKGDDFGVISFEDHEYYLKSFSAIYSDSTYGVVVVREKLDYIMLEDLKKTTSREMIIIRNNKIFTSTLYKENKRIENVDIKFNYKNLNQEKEIVIDGKKMLFHLIPLYDSSKNIIGYLGTGFSFDPIAYLYFKNTLIFLAYELLFSALMFIAIYLFLTYLFQPFNHIMKGIKNIGEGKYGNRINISSGKELQLVASGINSLSETVENRETELKELNNKLLEYSAELKSNNLKLNQLNEKLTEYSEELEIKNKKLIEIDKMKDNFLANTSHELKTPINGIIGLSEALTDGISGPLPEKAMFNLKMIISSGRRLLNLVNDILDFSKIRNKELVIEKKSINIKYLTDLVMFVCRPLLLNRPITLSNNIPDVFPSVYGDENRLQQVLYNLIGNAIKFTEKGEITVSATINSNYAEISIQDTGIGIPADKFNSIFESFEQVDSSTSRTYGGTGLGLSITKKLVELHKGEISVQSEVNKGSIFRFTIPLSKTDSSDNKIAVNNIPKNQVFELNSLSRTESISNDSTSYFPLLEESDNQFSILIVDDEIVNLQVMIDHLAIKNIQTEVAINGMEALEKIKTKKYDLILLDIMMPKISGYEVAQEVRKTYSYIELPILMLTAKNTTQDIELGFKSGANDYLTKPFEKKELLARISTLLGLKKAVEISNKNIKSLEKEHQLRNTAEKLREINDSLTSSLETNKIISSLFENIPAIINNDTTLFYLSNNNDVFQLQKWQSDKDIVLSPKQQLVIENLPFLQDILSKKAPLKLGMHFKISPFTNQNIENGVCLAIPVVYRDIVTAILIFENYTKDSISESIFEISHTIAGQTASALENSRLYKEVEQTNIDLRKNISILKSLESLSTLIYTEEDENLTISHILYIILTGLGFNYSKGAYIDLTQNRTNRISHLMLSDGNSRNIASSKIIDSMDLIEKDIKILSQDVTSLKIKKETFSKIHNLFKEISHAFIDNDVSNQEFVELVKELSFSNMICLPVEYENTKYGMIIFEKTDGKPTSQESDLLRAFSENLSLYLEKKRLEKEQLDGQPPLNYLCTSCNKKLLVYKGKADFIEIKCPRCNTFNTITK